MHISIDPVIHKTRKHAKTPHHSSPLPSNGTLYCTSRKKEYTRMLGSFHRIIKDAGTAEKQITHPLTHAYTIHKFMQYMSQLIQFALRTSRSISYPDPIPKLL